MGPKKKEEIYIVKFMSTGVAEAPYSKYSKQYNKFAIIKNNDDGRSIDAIIEEFRLQEEAEMQKVNSCKIVTKVVSAERILVAQILISKK